MKVRKEQKEMEYLSKRLKSSVPKNSSASKGPSTRPFCNRNKTVSLHQMSKKPNC